MAGEGFVIDGKDGKRGPAAGKRGFNLRPQIRSQPGAVRGRDFREKRRFRPIHERHGAC